MTLSNKAVWSVRDGRLATIPLSPDKNSVAPKALVVSICEIGGVKMASKFLVLVSSWEELTLRLFDIRVVPLRSSREGLNSLSENLVLDSTARQIVSRAWTHLVKERSVWHMSLLANEKASFKVNKSPKDAVVNTESGKRVVWNKREKAIC